MTEGLRLLNEEYGPYSCIIQQVEFAIEPFRHCNAMVSSQIELRV